jgi:cell division protease FtsH
MDRDVRTIVEALYARVKDAIERNRGALEALAEALLERETLEGSDAFALLQSHGVVMEEALRRRTADPGPRAARRPGVIRG